MTIESIERWEALLQSEPASRLSVFAAILAIVLATAGLASLLPPLPAAAVAAEGQRTGDNPEPIRLPVVLADAPR